MLSAASWTAEHFHHDWLVSLGLKYGIGIHHGRLPRSLARFMVNAFERKAIKILLCTSTLIEGVNTAARSVVIYDNKISQSNLDLFTFNNIRGRSGRMFQHYVGKVYLFDPPPEEELPFVDIPVFEPTADTPTSLLLKTPNAVMPEEARARLEAVLNQDVLPLDVIDAHPDCEPEFMIDAARTIRNLAPQEAMLLSWSGWPAYENISATSELIWNQLGGAGSARMAGVYTAPMMTYWISDLANKRNVDAFRRARIADLIGRQETPDDAVETVLAFLRNWASFNYPRYLAILSHVTDVILRERGLGSCNYLVFSTEIENLFEASSISALEEYGLPREIGEKFRNGGLFANEDGFGVVLDKLRRANLRDYASGEFESSVVADFTSGISQE